MALHDSLTIEEIDSHEEVCQLLRVRVSRMVKDGLMDWGDEYVITDAQAESLAILDSFHKDEYGETPLGPSDPLTACKFVAIAETGEDYKGDGSKADPSDLPTFKARLIRCLDKRAEQNIVGGQGFEYPASSGNWFSLSHAAQTKWNGLYATRASLTYPYKVPTKDDQTYYSIPDSATVESLYEAATAAVSAELASANAAKEGVVDAGTVAAARSAADAYLT